MTKLVMQQLELQKSSAGLLLSWLLTMILVPIGKWTVGSEVSTPVLMMVAVTLQAAAVGIILSRRWDGSTALAVFALVAFMGWLIEAIGTATGYPFGVYDYTPLLQPQIAHVPLLIPLAWFMMLPVSWAIATSIQHLLGWSSKASFIGLSAIAMTAWDLFLDPQMVHWGFWIWHDVPAINYFGIPWLNYFGWLLGSALMTAAVVYLIRPNWSTLPIRPFLFIYAITWFLETFGLLFFWGLPGPALIGGFVMGVLLLTACWPLLNNTPHPNPRASHD